MPRFGEVNKLFASIWIDDDNVLVGTKDNQLIIWNILRDYITSIPLAGRGPAENLPLTHQTGIHAIERSPNERIFATGANSPNDIALLRYPDFSVLRLLVGHTDWVFSLAFLNDETLVSGSRDGTIRLWKIPDHSYLSEFCVDPPVCHAALVKAEGTGKVRSLKISRDTGLLASAMSQGVLQFWDSASMDSVLSVDVSAYRDVVCTEYCEEFSVFVAGSLSHLLCVDPRVDRRRLWVVPSVDLEGIRSLSVLEHVCAAGGASGVLSFFDFRNSRFMSVEEPDGDDGAGRPISSLLGGPPPDGAEPPSEGSRDGEEEHVNVREEFDGNTTDTSEGDETESSGEFSPTWGHSPTAQGMQLIDTVIDAQAITPTALVGTTEAAAVELRRALGRLERTLLNLQTDGPGLEEARAVRRLLSHTIPRGLPITHEHGNVVRNDHYRLFGEESIRHAIYTISPHPRGGRLFVGGGPLQLGLSGAYAALWG